eukprot:GFKZ01005282.1.p1 GENE.GFKZ01005282.1~~GFKZ01005282.1.p1  ORF type:complete len:325 (+),score=73.47 GFKZ01005282.1:660-1634(+)
MQLSSFSTNIPATESHQFSSFLNQVTTMFTLRFLPYLLGATMIVLNTPICAKSASNATTSLKDFSAVFERAALKAFSPESTAQKVMELERLMATYIKMDTGEEPPKHGLLTVDMQIAMYRSLGYEMGEEEKNELRAEPCICEPISAFVGHVFDNAAVLLRHGAGLQKNCMRGFQQVLHIRALIEKALNQTEMPPDVEVSEKVCIDKVWIDVYNWLRGALIGMARNDGWFRATVYGETEDMRESLREKRRELLRVKINEVLDVEEVKPEPGEDFPAFAELDGCIREEENGDDSGDGENDDDSEDGENDDDWGFEGTLGSNDDGSN